MRDCLPALLAGFAGALIFVWLALPLPWLLGPIIGCLLLGRLGLRSQAPRALLNPARAILGLAIGSAFSPEMAALLESYLFSLLLVPPYAVAAGVIGYHYYRRVLGFDRITASLAAPPGGLAELSMLGAGLGARVDRLALAHSSRVLILVYAMPFLVQEIKGIDLGQAAGFGLQETAGGDAAGGDAALPWADYAAMAVLALAGWWLAQRLRLGGAPIVGPMLLSAAAHLSGFLSAAPPSLAIMFAQFAVGVMIGCAFRDLVLKTLLRIVAATALLLLVLCSLSAATAWLVASVTSFSFLSALLAFAPGGQAEMSLIALLSGEDTPYVAIHHIARMFLIISIFPLLWRWLDARRNSSQR